MAVENLINIYNKDNATAVIDKLEYSQKIYDR